MRLGRSQAACTLFFLFFFPSFDYLHLFALFIWCWKGSNWMPFEWQTQTMHGRCTPWKVIGSFGIFGCLFRSYLPNQFTFEVSTSDLETKAIRNSIYTYKQHNFTSINKIILLIMTAGPLQHNLSRDTLPYPHVKAKRYSMHIEFPTLLENLETPVHNLGGKYLN